LELKAI